MKGTQNDMMEEQTTKAGLAISHMASSRVAMRERERVKYGYTTNYGCKTNQFIETLVNACMAYFP